MSHAGGRTTVLLLTALLAGCGTGPAAGAAEPVAGPTKAPSRSVSRTPVPKSVPISYPARGGGRFRTAPAEPRTPGHDRVLRYRVLVEKDITGVTVDGFAAAVEQTLTDPRGWSAGGTRLRRVGPDQRYDFTIYLVTPQTRDELCQDVPDGYTSCRNGDRVVINVARWAHGVPNYDAPLSVYRQYAVNHETGHRLGHGHQLCPGTGQPAPVMEQQTLGLHGCVANPWPYLDGRQYSGPAGAYNDPVPAG